MSEIVSADHMVFVDYVLRDDNGVEIDSSPKGEPIGYLHGYGQVVRGLEKALEGQSAGATVRVTVPPEDGYGERDPERVITVSRSQFDFEPSVGGVVRAEGEGVAPHPFTIAEVTEDDVMLDANHPLAGMNLDFEVTVVSIRPATEEELAEAAEPEN